jgi:hypothetical protein
LHFTREIQFFHLSRENISLANKRAQTNYYYIPHTFFATPHHFGKIKLEAIAGRKSENLMYPPYASAIFWP